MVKELLKVADKFESKIKKKSESSLDFVESVLKDLEDGVISKDEAILDVQRFLGPSSSLRRFLEEHIPMAFSTEEDIETVRPSESNRPTDFAEPLTEMYQPEPRFDTVVASKFENILKTNKLH